MSFGVSIILCSLLQSFLFQLCHMEKVDLKYFKRRSSCDTCQHKLSFIELIPVISYLMVRGRCKHCKQKIPFVYVLGEVFALIPPFFIYFDRLQVEHTLFVCIYLFLLPAALYDIQHFEIPFLYFVIFATCTCFLAPHIYFIHFNMIVLLHLLFILSRHSIGYGDILVFALLSMVTPYLFFIMVFCFTFIIGGISTFIIMLIIKTKPQKIPLLPFIFLAFILTSNLYSLFISYIYL